ncbi:MAG TPA: ferritin-like domain-containing protein [Acidimicrobiales bacterium]|nr:ferritin-like domain-containing protein [Acidimicrobiales bacterium]
MSGLLPAATLVACTGPASAPEGPEDSGEMPGPDLDAMEFVAGLEVVAEAAYRQALASLTAGQLGEVPAAGSELLQSAATQHGQCLAAINHLLESAGRKAVTEPNIEFDLSVVTPELTAAKGWPQIAFLARTIETALAATYLQAIQSTLQARSTLRLAGGIQATGQKRVAILNFLLGEYPVPDAFQKTDAALTA